MTLAEDVNADQRAFWNGQPGQRWVDHEADLDRVVHDVAEILLREAAPQPGERILDIGCGAGATTRAFAERVGPAGAVTGLDISEPLLALAEERSRAAGIGNASLVAGDAQTLAFSPGSFDAAVSRFGVMFFADPVAAFRNIAAALRPGGRVVFAAWAGPEHNPWFVIPREAAVARLGPVPPPDPDAPGPMAFRDIDRVTGLFAAAGLGDCRGTKHAIDIHHPGGAAALAAMSLRIGPAASVLREAEGSEADAAAIAADLTGRFSGYATSDGVRLPGAINLFCATAI